VCAFACVCAYVCVAGGPEKAENICGCWIYNIEVWSFVPIQWKMRNETMALPISHIIWARIWKEFSGRRTSQMKPT